MGRESDGESSSEAWVSEESDRQLFRQVVRDISRNNIFCHCRQCQEEWVTSQPEPCRCGSRSVEWIFCWQFPDG